MTGSATVEVDAVDLRTAEEVADHAASHVHAAIRNVDGFVVAPTSSSGRAVV